MTPASNQPKSGSQNAKNQSRQQSRNIGAKGAKNQKEGKPQPQGRTTSAFFTWGIVAMVVVVAVVLVIVKLVEGPTTKATPTPGQLSASTFHNMTAIPASVYDKVGTNAPSAAGVQPLTVQTGQPLLKVTGKPTVFFMGAEFCPYCAADRWAVVASLSRFGTFKNLKTMESYFTDAFPTTQTVTFADATYSSPYITLLMRETASNKEVNGTHPALQALTKTEKTLVAKYDATKTHPTSSGTVPFLDIGNSVFAKGAAYSPAILENLSRTTISGGLKNPTDLVTQSIVAGSNYMSAGICSIDGTQPKSVCNSSGVKAAAKAMKLK